MKKGHLTFSNRTRNRIVDFSGAATLLHGGVEGIESIKDEYKRMSDDDKSGIKTIGSTALAGAGLGAGMGAVDSAIEGYNRSKTYDSIAQHAKNIKNDFNKLIGKEVPLSDKILDKASSMGNKAVTGVKSLGKIGKFGAIGLVGGTALGTARAIHNDNINKENRG